MSSLPRRTTRVSRQPSPIYVPDWMETDDEDGESSGGISEDEKDAELERLALNGRSNEYDFTDGFCVPDDAEIEYAEKEAKVNTMPNHHPESRVVFNVVGSFVGMDESDNEEKDETYRSEDEMSVSDFSSDDEDAEGNA
jgi:hypothetical protein